VHLYNEYFSITSVQNQALYVFLVHDAGKLIPGLELGWMLRPDDQMVLTMYNKRLRDDDLEEHNTRIFVRASQLDQTLPLTKIEGDKTLSGIKQRMMSFLYQKALKQGPDVLAHFYLTFEYFSNLVMWRMQFLDSDNILIKFGSRANIDGTTREVGFCHSSFFVFYNLSTTKVTDVYDNGSLEMYSKFDQSDMFRGVMFPNDPFSGVSSHSNNKYAKQMIEKQMQLVKNAKNGGTSQSIKRILSNLPLNPQSFSESPYFDLDLFSFDEKVIAAAERIRVCPDYPCKFYDRKTGVLKFKLDTNKSPVQTLANPTKKTAYYIFHPTDPFVISIQGSNQNIVINIHSRQKFNH
jgi:hypothetical protein